MAAAKRTCQHAEHFETTSAAVVCGHSGESSSEARARFEAIYECHRGHVTSGWPDVTFLGGAEATGIGINEHSKDAPGSSVTVVIGARTLKSLYENSNFHAWITPQTLRSREVQCILNHYH